MEIREVTAAIARSMRSALPGHHVDDEREGALHLGAFQEDILRGVVSGLPVGPEAQTDGSWLQVLGPFGAHGPSLVDRLAEIAEERGATALWSPLLCPSLQARGERYQRFLGYSAASIEVLDSVDAVRKRPGMYVGSTGAEGVTHLLYELVSNGIDEHLAGHATQMWVQIGQSGITVADDGRGIPVDIDSQLLERLCTIIAASSHRGELRRHVHIGSYGLGLVVVNALSSVMVVTIDRGQRYQQVFSRGRKVVPLLEIGPAIGRGTAVWFAPDAGIFSETLPDIAAVTERLSEVAILHPHFAVHLDGRLLPSMGGLKGYARHLAGEGSMEWSTQGCSDGIAVEIAVCWGSGAELTCGWANDYRCEGSHIDGLLAGLAGTHSAGRVALVSVSLDPIQYAGRTRSQIAMPEVETIVRGIVAAELPKSSFV